VSITGKRLLCGFTAAALSLWLAAPASADPDGPPACTLGIVCAFVPFGAPDLDHDLDLTKDQPPVPDQDTAPPVNPCSAGCI
jgi:hypothetical protein